MTPSEGECAEPMLSFAAAPRGSTGVLTGTGTDDQFMWNLLERARVERSYVACVWTRTPDTRDLRQLQQHCLALRHLVLLLMQILLGRCLLMLCLTPVSVDVLPLETLATIQMVGMRMEFCTPGKPSFS